MQALIPLTRPDLEALFCVPKTSGLLFGDCHVTAPL